MKRPIQWHRDRLAALRDSRLRYVEEARRAQERVERITNDVVFLERQITEAEKRGMDAFDEDRLLVPRKVQALLPRVPVDPRAV